jgi:hypothetical protein
VKLPVWLKDWRVATLAVGCAVAGFLVATFIFGKPWHLPPNWGDIPTWLLFLAATVAGWAALVQLVRQQEQINEEAVRNAQRDELMKTQLAEAELRATDRRREQAASIDVSVITILGPAMVGRAMNNSRRPIRDVTCKVMSRVDDGALALSDQYLPPVPIVGGRSLGVTTTGSRISFIRPGWVSGFVFTPVTSPDRLIVVWFTDDAGMRWQLDEDLHLVRAAPDDLFVPTPESRLA